MLYTLVRPVESFFVGFGRAKSLPLLLCQYSPITPSFLFPFWTKIAQLLFLRMSVHGACPNEGISSFASPCLSAVVLVLSPTLPPPAVQLRLSGFCCCQLPILTGSFFFLFPDVDTPLKSPSSDPGFFPPHSPGLLCFFGHFLPLPLRRMFFFCRLSFQIVV